MKELAVALVLAFIGWMGWVSHNISQIGHLATKIELLEAKTEILEKLDELK